MSSDSGFKQLFAFPELALELLRCAVPERWTKRLKISNLARVNGSYVGPNGQQRHDDMVWRIDISKLLAIFMVVEFQASQDRLMDARMQSYISLLREDLIKQGQVKPGVAPILLPIVLYSGPGYWKTRSGVDTSALHILAGLESLQGEQKYLVVDRSTQSAVMKALIDLDRGDARNSDPRRSIAVLNTWLRQRKNAALTRTVTDWVIERVTKQFPDFNEEGSFEMKDIHMMFEHNFRTYTELLEYQTLMRGRDEGRLEGRQEGRQEGREEGRQEGRQEGREEGREEGRQEGRREGQWEATQRERRYTVKLLMKHTGTPLSTNGTERLQAASAEQLLEWINQLDEGRSPQALVE